MHLLLPLSFETISGVRSRHVGHAMAWRAFQTLQCNERARVSVALYPRDDSVAGARRRRSLPESDQVLVVLSDESPLTTL